MLISAAQYHEMYIKNKDVEKIVKEVAELRRGIAGLKRRIESPSYYSEEHMAISEIDQVDASREYLATAIAELERLGAYEPCEEELVCRYVESSNPDIRRIVLTIGVHFERKYDIDISGENGRLTVSKLHESEVEYPIEKDRVMRVIEELHMGEWRDTYLPEHYGCSLSEPEKWQLRIEYSSGRAPRFYDGAGVYPYNFSRLAEIMKYEM